MPQQDLQHAANGKTLSMQRRPAAKASVGMNASASPEGCGACAGLHAVCCLFWEHPGRGMLQRSSIQLSQDTRTEGACAQQQSAREKKMNSRLALEIVRLQNARRTSVAWERGGASNEV